MKKHIYKIKEFFIKSEIKYLLLFIFLSIFLHLISANFNLHSVITGGDTDFPLKGLIEIKNSFSTWKNEALGMPEYFPLSRIFLSIIPFLFELVSGVASSLLTFSFLWALAGYFMYLLVYRLTKNRLVAILTGFFYLINPYSYIRYHTPVLHIQLAYIAFPLLTYLAIKIVTKELSLKLGTIIYSIILISIARTTNLWALYIVVIPSLTFLFSRMKIISWTLSKKKSLIFFITVIIVNLVVLFMLVSSALNYLGGSENNQLISYYRNTQENISINYKIWESLGGWGTYSWTQLISEELPGWQAFSIFKGFPKSFWVILSLVTPLFAIISNLKGKYLLLVLATVFSLILMNGFGVPFGNIYETVFGNLPIYKDLFRDTWGYWGGVYIFLISLLLGLSLNNISQTKLTSIIDRYSRNAILISLFLINVVMFVLMYIAPGKIIHESWHIEIPTSYIEVAKYFNSKEDGTRVLPLPLTSQPFGYTETTWGYKGPDILNRVSEIDLIDKHLNSIAPISYINLLSDIENLDDYKLVQILEITGTKQIILRKDFKDQNISFKKYENLITSNNCFSKEFGTEYLDVYKYDCVSGSIPLFSQSGSPYLGNWNCGNGLSYNSENVKSSLVCSNLKLDLNTLKVENNSLKYNLIGSNTYVKSNKYISDIFVNNLDLNNEIRMSNETEVRFDLSNDKYDLISNRDFKSGLWMNEIATCNNLFDNIDIVTNTTKGLSIISNEKPVCIFQKIQNPINQSDYEGVIKLRYKNEKEVSPPTLNIYSEKSKENIFSIDLNNINSLETKYSIKSEIDFLGYTTVYVHINDLSNLDSNSYLYLVMNPNNEYFQTNISELRFIKIPKEINDIKLITSSYENKDFEINTQQYKSYFFGTLVKLKDVKSDSKIINFNSNFNRNWKLITFKKGELLPYISPENNHVMVNDWSNGWIIENTNKSDNVWIVYIPQLLYLIGIFLSVIAIITLLLIV
jgi:hypothetical protein